MTKEVLGQFESILDKEGILISDISSVQKDMRCAVQEKNWPVLVSLIDKMNELSSDFANLDADRDAIQNEMTSAEIKPYNKKLLLLRSKLAQSKIENKVLNDYISITRGFINGVLDKASTKTYSRYGQIIQKQPLSVLVSTSL